MEIVINDIQALKENNILSKIDKGWSFDTKYIVTNSDNTKYLLRVSPIENYSLKEKEFQYLTKLKDSNLNISIPIEIGVCNNGNSTYTIYNWIEGDDANLVIPSLSKDKQYDLGFESGVILKKIQSIIVEEHIEPWEIRYGRKIEKKIQEYKNCSLKLPGGYYALKYLEENKHLLKGRPTSFLHGDFHIGNMVCNGSDIGIIDFNRFDFGDPFEDFNRMFFSAELSPIFAKGIIDGYFNRAIPEDFFPLMLLYTALNQISSLTWSMQFGQVEIDNAYKTSSNILKWYDNYDRLIPSWYEEALL